jgi:hypothetical protein
LRGQRVTGNQTTKNPPIKENLTIGLRYPGIKTPFSGSDPEESTNRVKNMTLCNISTAKK